MSEIKNDPNFFSSQGFKKDTANDIDLDQKIYLEWYTKSFVKGVVELDVTFYYKENNKGKNVLEEVSISISVEGSTTETIVETYTELNLLIIHLKAVSQFVKQ